MLSSRTQFIACAVIFVAASLGGCASRTLWESAYIGERTGPLAPTEPVQIRKVAWERVQDTLKSIESESATSDVHPLDWAENKKAEMRARLLKGLQVSSDPAGVKVLGRSDFRTTTTLRPDGVDESELAAFARTIGATRVAWTSSYLGKADTIVQEPVSTWRTGTDLGGNDDRRGRRARDYSENSTTWVPVRVQGDEYAFVAYFLRDE